MTTQTDVNDLLRRVLREGEWYRERRQEAICTPDFPLPPNTIFKEAHAYLDSLERGPDCPNRPECGGPQCYRLDSLEARMTVMHGPEMKMGWVEEEVMTLKASVERIEKVLRVHLANHGSQHLRNLALLDLAPPSTQEDNNG